MNYSNKKLIKNKKPNRVISNDKIINGQRVNAKNIIKATQTLSKNNVTKFTNTTDVSLDALNLFDTIGCTTVDGLDKNFTLITEQTDDETLTNPNIDITKSKRPTKRKNLDATKSFPNVDDPFYEVDVGRKENTQQKQATERRLKSGNKITRLASDIALVNTDKSFNSTLKQFKSQTSHGLGAPQASGKNFRPSR